MSHQVAAAVFPLKFVRYVMTMWLPLVQPGGPGLLQCGDILHRVSHRRHIRHPAEWCGPGGDPDSGPGHPGHAPIHHLLGLGPGE